MKFAFINTENISLAKLDCKTWGELSRKLMDRFRKYDGWVVVTDSCKFREFLVNSKKLSKVSIIINNGYWSSIIYFSKRKHSSDLNDYIILNQEGVYDNSFYFYVFKLLGAEKDDVLIDIFTDKKEIVNKAFQMFIRQTEFTFTGDRQLI